MITLLKYNLAAMEEPAQHELQLEIEYDEENQRIGNGFVQFEIDDNDVDDQVEEVQLHLNSLLTARTKLSGA